MSQPINAVLIHDQDNVITVKEALAAGAIASYLRDGKVMHVDVREDIPRFHKIALVNFQTADPVIKYGALIGKATKPIKRGGYVHDHNIAGSPKKP